MLLTPKNDFKSTNYPEFVLLTYNIHVAFQHCINHPHCNSNMAEIYFRCSENEFLAFTKHILSRGCYLVSGVFRATPDLICIHNKK